MSSFVTSLTSRTKTSRCNGITCLLGLFLSLHLGLSSAGAEQTHLGSIGGTVTDPSGAVIIAAEIKLTHEQTNLTRTTISTSDGAFSISQLEPGTYQLQVKLTGYKTFLSRATVQVNHHLRIDASLEIGNLNEQIIVSAPATVIEQDSVALSTIIRNKQITSLPLDGRNFLLLSLIAPGTSPAAQGSAGSVRGDFTFSVNGAREDMNSFLLDGAVNIDPKLNTPSVHSPVDAISEFQVLTSTYDAAFGQHAGGHVNVITKSGTNRINGTLYEFFRNQTMNARNTFASRAAEDPDYNRNQFGASLGGPLIQNRTFFFVNYEGSRHSEGITRVTNVPTLAERTGDFSQSALPKPINLWTGQPFPNGKIPQSYLHPIGVAIAGLYPEPNRGVPSENFVSSPTLRDRKNHFNIRLDHALGSNSQLTTRYSISDRRLFEPFSGQGFSAVPGFGTNVPRRAQNLMISNTSVLSSTLVNDVRVVFNRVSGGSFHENTGTSINRSIGLPELSDNPRDWGLSFITVSGFSPLGDEYNNPQQSTTNTFQILDTLTYAHGGHLLKFGFDARIVRQDAFRDVQSRGFMTFSSMPSITGNSLADLLMGLPLLTGGAVLDNSQRLRTESYSLFVHDNLRLSPNLTLSAGLRYEYNSPPVDVDDRANTYDPTTQSLIQVGTRGIPRAAYNADKNNFSPRVGLSWSPTADGKTVLRSGYGIYYDTSSLAPNEGLYFNPPFFDFSLYFPVQGLPLTVHDPFPEFFPIPIPSSALAFQRDMRTPYLQHWSANVQRQLGSSRSLEFGYVGSRGSNLIGARDINQATPNPQPFNLRPVPHFADIVSLESRGSSLYNSFQIKFTQRLDSGFSMASTYTLGKSTDDVSNFFSSTGDPNFPQDSNNPEAEQGRSNFDVRHRFALHFLYELPFGSGHRFLNNGGWTSRLFENWQLVGMTTLQSGRPFTVALRPEIDNSNTGRAALGFGANDRPNLVGDLNLSNRSASQWFTTGAFALPPFGHFGDAGRNILDGPGFQNASIALLKQIPLNEDVRLQLRFEAFNLLNRVNLHLPDNFFGSPTFGRILSSGSPRRLQLGLKLLF